jgi:hypothetical protein
MSDEASGWHAIDEALRPLYGKRKPFHWGTIISYALGGNDPLQGISAYKNDHTTNAPVPHWHYITYGFSELYDKESDDPAVSGWGFEMTFRLACGAEQEPPLWPLNLLQNFARYVFRTGNVFGAGHHLNLNSPIALEEETAIRAVLFTPDPQLPARDTPNGRLEFLQVVGITLDELTALYTWNPTGLLDLLRHDNPLLITDLQRTSILARPEAARAVQEGVRRDGSSTSGIYVTGLDWEKTAPRSVQLTLSALFADQVARLLPARLLHGRDFELYAKEKPVRFQPGEHFALRSKGERLTLDLPADLVKRIEADLKPQRGTCTWPEYPRFTIRVIPGEIKDQQGQVIQVVG